MILLRLDMRTLLLSQRVARFESVDRLSISQYANLTLNRSWKALMDSSINIRRALFLEPVASGALTYIDWKLDDKDWYDGLRGRLSLGEPLRGPDRKQKPKS
jgi:hypothetical protein